MAIALNDKVLPAEENPDSMQPGYLGPATLTDKPPMKAERTWVDRPEQLLDAVDVLKQAKVVAVDAEFSQVRSRAQGDVQTSSNRMPLLQLAIGGRCFMVDTLRLSGLT